MRRSKILAAIAVTAVSVAAALVPATAVHAASGTGWSASWSYYLDDNYRFDATLPGVQVVGFASDSGGHRFAGASLVDTAADGRCAVVAVFDDAFSLLAQQTVCDGQPYVTFSFSVFGGHQVALQRRDPATGDVDKALFLNVPGSVHDPELRRAGTGASWSYYTDRDYQVSLQRPGVRLTGFGNRSVSLGSVEHTGGAGTCVQGRITDLFDGEADTASTCNPGGFETLALFGIGDRGVAAEACVEPAVLCVRIDVPEPF